MKISDALQGIRLLYVETAPFIYFVEEYPAYIDRMRAIFQYLSLGRLEVATSVITVTETLAKPLKTANSGLLREYSAMFLTSRNVRLISVNTSVAQRAAHLRAKHNLKTPDALQISTALEIGCDAFLTNDRGIKRITELPILMIDDLELDPPPQQTLQR